jgi:hypothetical protein
MFRGSQLKRYFARAGSSKSVSTATSSSGHETSANIISEGSMTQNNFNPILIGSCSKSTGSLPSVMVYPASDPRYEHPPRFVAKRSCDTSDSVYNKPRSR